MFGRFRTETGFLGSHLVFQKHSKVERVLFQTDCGFFDVDFIS